MRSYTLFDACVQAGVKYLDIPPDGCFHRSDILDDPHGKGDAALLLRADGSGIVWNWKNQERCIYFNPQGHQTGLALQTKRMSAMLTLEEKHRKARYLSKEVWEKAEDVRNDHPYLLKKHIQAEGLIKELPSRKLRRLLGYSPSSSKGNLSGRILICLCHDLDLIRSLAFIDESGNKSCLAGGEMKGAFWSTQALPKNRFEKFKIGIAEGVATALSAKKLFDFEVLAAIGSANLVNVAESVSKHYPNAQITILSDVGNGMEYALKAAQRVRAKCEMPKFTPSMNDEFFKRFNKKPTDFNDFWILNGAHHE